MEAVYDHSQQTQQFIGIDKLSDQSDDGLNGRESKGTDLEERRIPISFLLMALHLLLVMTNSEVPSIAQNCDPEMFFYVNLSQNKK